jgi:hypothetical protein
MLPGKAFRIGRLSLDTTAAGFEAAAMLGKGLFVGGASLFYIPDPTVQWVDLKELKDPSALPQDTLASIAISPLGPVALSTWRTYRLEGQTWNRQAPLPAHSEEITRRQLKTIVGGIDNDFWIGSWGFGLLRYKDGKLKEFGKKELPCIDTVVFNYPVVQAISDPLGNHLWFSVNLKEGGRNHQLAHFELSTLTVTCVPDYQETGVQIRSVKLLSDSLLTTSGDDGLALYRVLGADGDRISPLGHLGTGEQAWDAALDSYGKVWALAGGQLKFVDSVFSLSREQLKFVSAPGFPGRECRNLESDVRGRLWAGCQNGLYQITPGPSGTQKVVRHSPENGMIGWNILDLAVDQKDGSVWVSTDRGISRYESSSLPPLKKLKTVKAYPNPFRSQHTHLVINPVPINATVRILSESGAVLRTLRPNEIEGNQAQWDGRDQQGRRVNPGLYYYSVESSGETERGKVVVAR